jgi:Bacterial Ig domain
MGDFDFEDRPVPIRKPAKSGMSPLMIAIGVLGLGALAVGGLWLFSSKPVELMLDPISEQTVAERETLTVNLKATAQGLKPGEWTYGLIAAPPGAKVDPKSGVFTWKPNEDMGATEQQITVAAQSKGDPPAQAKRTFKIKVTEVNEPPVIAEIPPQTVAAGSELRLTIKATDADKPPQTLTYRLKSGPKDAKVDAASGQFTWSPSESGTAQDLSAEVVVADAETGGAEALAKFTIKVTQLASPVLRFAAALREAGLAVEKVGGDPPPGFHGTAWYFGVAEEPVTILEYETASAASDDQSQVEDNGQLLFGEPATWKTKTHLFRKDQLIVVFGGTSERVLKSLSNLLGEPFVVADVSTVVPKPERPVEPTILDKLVDSLAKLHAEKDLLGKKDYPGVRKLFTEFFEAQNEFTLTKFGEADGAAFKKWLDEHQDFKEEFFTGLEPGDNFDVAYKIVQSLHQKFPTKLADYGQLAIATAVTWDNERNVDHYDGHQRRTHSTMPSGLLNGIENFQYYVDAAGAMQGRAQYLPWEFLVYLVNHRTPRPEREWAVANYVAKRTMYGKCYHDVPYDNEMLRTSSKTCKLDGKEYTLSNIQQFGGVCAMQADFASRVGKSIGVPAEYVGGEAAGGELHAWVMWVELKQVTRTAITFTLESHGRYQGDKYYVGTLRDPQSGRGTTDRELELRLQAVGLNPVAFRHARLVMQVYPQLRDKLKLTPSQEIIFLNDVIELCPGNEAAWEQVAKLALEGKITSDSYRLMTVMFDKLFRTFASFPDFTWKVFDDLVQYQKNEKQRDKYYERLVQMYEAADRPDLACEARMKLSDYLLEEGKSKEVIAGLAFTIKKFPDEGRYVPRLLDKLEQVCSGIKGADQQVLQFYQEFIPLIPQKRGSASSPYCMRMLERAIAKFNAAGLPQQAQGFAAELAKLKAAEK